MAGVHPEVGLPEANGAGSAAILEEQLLIDIARLFGPGVVLSVREAAELLRVSTDLLYQRIADESVPALCLGDRKVICRRWLARQLAAGPAPRTSTPRRGRGPILQMDSG